MFRVALLLGRTHLGPGPDRAPAARRRRRLPSPSRASRPMGMRLPSRRAATSGPCPRAGGDARLLISNAATETRPLYSPDKTRLAFVSTRTGGGDIYVLTFATGEVRRVTFDDGLEQLDGWSRDGQWLYFSSSVHDLSGGDNDIYRVSAAGGTPMPVSADRYENEFFAAASPDGKTLAMSARGTASGQWWRHGRSHLDEAEIWLRDLTAPDTPAAWRALTTGGAKDLWPMWAGDGTVPLLRLRSRRRGEHLADAADARCGPADRSRTSPTGACSGPRPPCAPTPSSSSATSRSGRWTRQAARAPRFPSRGLARRPARASSICA